MPVSPTLEKIKRLRAYEELTRRMDWAAAERSAEVVRAEVADVARELRGALGLADSGTVGELAQHHAYALRQEMGRRQALGRLQQVERAAATRQAVWRHAEREHRIAEKLLEERQERHAWERAQQEQKHLDEAASAGWWRGDT